MTRTHSIIDCHVHLAALPDGDNGCFISKKMLGSPALKLVAVRQGLPLDQPDRANALYVEKLKKTLGASQFVQKAVILGMDGAYGDDGLLDREKTEFLISNDYVLKVCREHPDLFLPGISINPQRRDAIEELERCAAQRPALIKMLPNTQSFNPAKENYRDFYRAAAKHKIPLLTHVGFEFTLLGQDQSVGDLIRWRGALEEGAIVIAAHGASHGIFVFEKHWDALNEFVRMYKNFYWDASALSLPNRAGMLLKLRRFPELLERMVFGTDYPLPAMAYPALLAGQWKNYGKLVSLKNPFDRHFALLEGMGFPVRKNILPGWVQR